MGIFRGNVACRVVRTVQLTDAGWATGWASLAAVVLCPLDDSPPRGGEFERLAEREARRLARALRGASQSDGERIVFDALRMYREAAARFGETYYVQAYGDCLRRLEGLPSARTGESLTAFLADA